MPTKKFRALNSEGVSAYTVIVEWNGKDLYVACDCKAGSLGDWCRHKSGVLNGEESILADGDTLTDVLTWVSLSSVSTAIARIREAENQRSDAEASLKKAKANVLAAKKVVMNLINQHRND